MFYLKRVTVLRVSMPIGNGSNRSMECDWENSSWKEVTQELVDSGSLQERKRLPFHPGKAVSQKGCGGGEVELFEQNLSMRTPGPGTSTIQMCPMQQIIHLSWKSEESHTDLAL